MTSILEQFERASLQTHVTPAVASDLSSFSFAGYVPVRSDEDVPIFTRQKVDFSPSHPLTHMAVSNGHLLLAMGNKSLLKVEMSNPAPPEVVDLSKLAYQAVIYRIFLDPSGNHAIIIVSGRDRETPVDALYLHWKSNKPKQLSRYKGHLISAVAWVPHRSNEESTGRLLLGTTKGLIFEAELTMNGERFFQSGAEGYSKQIFDLSTSAHTPQPVTSLALIQVPPGTGRKFLIFATTPSRIYHFQGTVIDLEDKPLFGQIFSNYANAPARFQEIPGSPPHSSMRLFQPSSEDIPKSLAWLTEPGIFFAKLDMSDTETGVGEPLLISHAKSSSKPRALAITEYHALVADRNTLRGFSVLDEHLVFEDAVLESHGNIVALERDPVRGTIFVCCEHSIFRLRVVREAKDVWRVLVSRRRFDEARRLTSDDPIALDTVMREEADYLFQQKKFEESAAIFAKTRASFEEVTLKFISAKEEVPLRTYLRTRLESLKPAQKAQNAMIVSWLLELYLNAVGSLADRLDGAPEAEASELARTRAELRDFLGSARVREVVSENKAVIYDLLTSHGDTETLMYFALQMRDYDHVIQHHIGKGDHRQALETLQRHCPPDAFYKYSPSLLRQNPRGMVNLLIEQGRKLSPSKLMPALVTTQGDPVDLPKEVLRYLEFAVNELSCEDTALHNYLLSLLAKYAPDKILQYLEVQRQTIDVPYDPQFALRVCQDSELPKASALVYAQLGLYEDAIDVSLKVDIALAKEIANIPTEDQDLRKKLWLKIAKHVVQEEEDIGKAMEFLGECPLIKIEDILPFFPDFVTIDHFKDAICSSLESYSNHIESLHEEMEEATKATEVIKEEMNEFRHRFAFVAKEDKCSSCSYPLLIRGFYVFPCGHRFHGDCLYEDRIKSLPEEQKKKVVEVKRQLSVVSGTTLQAGKAGMDAALLLAAETLSTGSSSTAIKEQLKAELDELLANDCFLCGDNAIDTIDLPLVSPSDVQTLGRDWL